MTVTVWQDDGDEGAAGRERVPRQHAERPDQRALPAVPLGQPAQPSSGSTPAVPTAGAAESATVAGHVADLAGRRAGAEQGPDLAATERHRARGKSTARERIDLLLDLGSFTELNLFAEHRAVGFGMEASHPPGDGVVTGWGTIDGRTVAVFAHDARVHGGALGEVFAAKIHRVLDLAESIGAPVVGLNDGGGARIQEGVAALAGFGGIPRPRARRLARGARRSGRKPGGDRPPRRGPTSGRVRPPLAPARNVAPS